MIQTGVARSSLSKHFLVPMAMYKYTSKVAALDLLSEHWSTAYLVLQEKSCTIDSTEFSIMHDVL